MSDETKSGRGLFKRLRGVIGEASEEGTRERRASQRVKLPIPVLLKVADRKSEGGRLHDISQQGLSIEAAGYAVPGEAVIVRFDGRTDVCGPFILAGEIVRVTEDAPPRLVIHIDRERTPTEALTQYRALVLHYLRHKPLLDEIGKGYFDGRCESCGWVGHVGSKRPTCPRCGQGVVPVAQ